MPKFWAFRKATRKLGANLPAASCRMAEHKGSASTRIPLTDGRSRTTGLRFPGHHSQRVHVLPKRFGPFNRPDFDPEELPALANPPRRGRSSRTTGWLRITAVRTHDRDRPPWVEPRPLRAPRRQLTPETCLRAGSSPERSVALAARAAELGSESGRPRVAASIEKGEPMLCVALEAMASEDSPGPPAGR